MQEAEPSSSAASAASAAAPAPAPAPMLHLQAGPEAQRLRALAMPEQPLAPAVIAAAGGGIVISAAEFQTAIDCTNRALLAAQQAERVAMAASKAFAAEVSALIEVKHHLEHIKMRASRQ